MAWRLAKSLDVLRAEINEKYPNRDKSADGTIGDEAHSSRSSDHNPNSASVVCALDITHDPRHGLDAGKLADELRLSGDPRIKYVISNRRIANSGAAWRKYSGANPHDHHFHISVHGNYDSIAPWNISDAMSTSIIDVLRSTMTPKSAAPFLVKGSKGKDVERLQSLLKIKVDGEFGPKTESAVKAFQKKSKLVADGKVGTYTWKALDA